MIATKNLRQFVNGSQEPADNLQQPASWLPVLMYHRVVDRLESADPYHLNILTDDFDAQMAYLKDQGYQSIPLDMVPLAVSGKSIWNKPIAISFDDGYLDNYTHAFPILKKYGLVATVMLVSDCIGGRNDWDAGRTAPAQLLSRDHIREMAAHGIHFGAHTATHASLAEVDLKRARRELAVCKTKLEQLLVQEITTLAYPYGRSTPYVCNVAEEVGFAAAFGVERWTKDMLNFGRIDAAATPGDTLLWRLKLSGHYMRLRESNVVRLAYDLPKRIRALAMCGLIV